MIPVWREVELVVLDVFRSGVREVVKIVHLDREEYSVEEGIEHSIYDAGDRERPIYRATNHIFYVKE